MEPWAWHKTVNPKALKPSKQPFRGQNGVSPAGVVKQKEAQTTFNMLGRLLQPLHHVP